MKNQETKNLILLIIVIVIFGLFSLAYDFFVKDKDVDNEVIDTETISIVTDHNRFYTVSSCVSKYINYLVDKDTDNLFILLSSDYIKKNNIISGNIYSYIGTIKGNRTFTPVKMYKQRLNSSLTKYYVYGNLQKESINGISDREGYYLIVILDEKNMTFAIEPYDGSIFMGD